MTSDESDSIYLKVTAHDGTVRAKKRENSSYSPGSVMSQEKTKSLFFSFWLVSFHTFNMGKLSCI